MSVDKKYIVNLQGKDFVTFSGLLDLAHQQGLVGVDENIVQIPTNDNGLVAVVQAKVTTEKGVFSGIGDASPDNVGKMVAKHLLRMASTRAIARALRVATNVGITAFEELGGDSDDFGSSSVQDGTNGSDKPMSDKQKKKTWAMACSYLDNGDKNAVLEFLNGNCDAMGFPVLSDLSSKQASHLIETLGTL